MEKHSLKSVIEKVITSPNVVSRTPIYETYDKNVQGNTVWERGVTACSMTACFRDFPELPLEVSAKAVSVSGGGNPNLAKICPKVAAQNAVMEAAFVQACVGAVPLASTDCLNFGNPEKEDQMGELVVGIEGVKQACETLDIPIVSGNVSLYNESAGRSIPPSAIISIFGRVDEVEKVKPLAFPQEEISIFVLGRRSENLGGSELLNVFAKEDSNHPEINYESFMALSENVSNAIASELFESITPIQRGGAIAAILRSAFIGNTGANINIPTGAGVPSFLFSEDLGAVVTTKDPAAIQDLFGNDAIEVGTVSTTEHLTISQEDDALVDEDLANWKDVWQNRLREIF